MIKINIFFPVKKLVFCQEKIKKNKKIIYFLFFLFFSKIKNKIFSFFIFLSKTHKHKSNYYFLLFYKIFYIFLPFIIKNGISSTTKSIYLT